ncbi:MAG TPA: DUF1269 domain-containing protein [Longimicrobiaceae bacterium]|nr:DUF1269 domain-containing protein [Longimicrobiaceae bacterium]
MPDETEWHVPRLCVVLFRFPGVQGAHDAVQEAKADGWHREGVEADALVSHEASGKVHMHDPGAAVMGGAFGVTTATILGLVGGPWVLLAMVAAGGLLGGIAGHFAGRIIPAEDLRRVGEALPPDSSAYLVLVEDHDVERVEAVFAGRAEGVLSLPVATELAGAMGPGLTRQMKAG